jgi:hypothetical protein
VIVKPEDKVVDLVLVQPDQSLDRIEEGHHRHLDVDEATNKKARPFDKTNMFRVR